MKQISQLLIFLIPLIGVGQSNSIKYSQKTTRQIDEQWFIENKGQWPEDVLFFAQIHGLNAWITKVGITYDFYATKENYKEDRISQMLFYDNLRHKSMRRYGQIVNWKFENSNKHPLAEGKKKYKAYYNYFIGKDKKKWASFVGLYKEVYIKNIYKGIDARYYFDDGLIRYDFIVQAGADPAQLALTIEGCDKVFINNGGELVYSTRFGDVKQAGLKVYQMEGVERKRMNAQWQINSNNKIQFLLGTYNKKKAIVIDPIVYSTFIGGRDPDIFFSMDMLIDRNGNAFIAGSTSSSNYPIISGAYDSVYAGELDFYVTKLNSSGSELIYSTFIGGSDPEHFGYTEDCYSIALDNSDNIYITGDTHADDYPTTIGAYKQTISGKYDAVITKLNSSGSEIIYSTFLGGEDNDSGRSIWVDNNGNAFICGTTYSSYYPTTTNAFDEHFNGNVDGFVTALNNNGSSLLLSTFLGGYYFDFAKSIITDNKGYIYVAGSTSSNDFPITAGAFDTSYEAYYDIFVTKLDPAGEKQIYSTFIGGDKSEYCSSILVDDNGNTYLSGSTNSFNFPTTKSAYDQTYSDSGDAFMLKLNSEGSALTYCTFLGGTGLDEDYDNNLAIDKAGNAYVVGGTSSTDFPISSDAFSKSKNGYFDVFLSKFNNTGSQLIYSTFIGGGMSDAGYSVDVDSIGNIYVAGEANSVDFPTTTGSYDQTYNGDHDIFVTKLYIDNIVPVNIISFAASIQQGKVLLTWLTTNETGNDCFIIERRSNNNNFINIGKVYSKGNGTLSYSFTDNNSQKGTSYYRLKQVDKDGQFSYSKIASVSLDIQNSLLTISPNPTTGNTTLTLSNNNKKITIKVSDANGKVVWQTVTSESSVIIPSQQFAGGLYNVQVAGEKGMENLRFIKQ